jgi:hypothetical protein
MKACLPNQTVGGYGKKKGAGKEKGGKGRKRDEAKKKDCIRVRQFWLGDRSSSIST